MSADPSSRTLLANVAQGDEVAAGEVCDRYLLRMIGLVRGKMSPPLRKRVDPEDIVQSALRSFFVRARDDSVVLRRSGDLWRLLATIALSKLRRQVEIHTAAKRAVNREQSARGDEPVTLDVRGDSPQPHAAAALLDELEHYVQGLDVEQREVLHRRLAGESVEDIALSLNRSQRTIRRWLHQSRKDLEQRLLSEE